ncbi:unnamed protein product [Notodromas monacha]|uniref:Uncharacterized protein n=1 Tax=Notodromas monacha TaxID=399045 RepID=A0A7R9BM78_9CRUS|nr:unnamed protein product [Notodromas monacha]CAG0918072.1 unnamed protein product [Notodromas monacha]
MSLEVLAMMGAGVPPNVAHFNQDKLAVKYPLLLKFGNSTTQVAQDLMITLALSEVKAGKKVQFVTERPLTRFPVQGPKNLPPPPQLLDGIDFW